jgi:hypothetical protein
MIDVWKVPQGGAPALFAHAVKVHCDGDGMTWLLSATKKETFPLESKLVTAVVGKTDPLSRGSWLPPLKLTNAALTLPFP